MRQKVFITTTDMALALVWMLQRAGVDPHWVSEEEGEKLEEAWKVGGWIRAN